MVNRRMFSLKIIDTDYFIEMPLSARLLYYDLAMRADDEGFVGSPHKIIRMTNASIDDLKILSAKKFIIPFDSGVCVITHWRVHNYINPDRREPTFYCAERESLDVDDNGVYFVHQINDVAKMPTKCSQNVDKMSTKCAHRIGKDSIGKDNNTYSVKKSAKLKASENFSEIFETMWALYPHPQYTGKSADKLDVWRKWQKILESQKEILGAKSHEIVDENQLLKTVENYNADIQRRETHPQYFYKATNFFGQKAYYINYLHKQEIFVNETIKRNNANDKTTKFIKHRDITDEFEAYAESLPSKDN